MIVGIGTDIVQISRIANMLSSFERIERLFTKNEQNYAESKHYPMRHYAGMWAAKEAFMKASGYTDRAMVGMEVCHYENGKPWIQDHETRTKANLSISHDGDYATAFVIMGS